MIKNILISNFLVVLGINSQTRINAYTLILEKDFRICKRKKKVFVIQKLNYLISNIDFTGKSCSYLNLDNQVCDILRYTPKIPLLYCHEVAVYGVIV